VSRTYVQLGAGAGDRDAATDYRDGFTEAVKAVPLEPNDRIILVEANPYNIPMLREFWEGWPQAEVLNIGIQPSSESSRRLKFFYADEDAPHYQVFSLYPDHVRKHYPRAELKSVEVACLSAAEFIGSVVGDDRVALFAIDIEGADAAVMLDINWRTFDCRAASFEALHLGSDGLS
jgi:Methyltransferase FkbM domain